jgi:hypothetical protein
MAKRGSAEWRELVRDALSELDPEKLPEKIALAEVAVCRRIEQVRPKTGTESERQALHDALSSLNILKESHFPGWKRR